jgi:hypothetical protein
MLRGRNDYGEEDFMKAVIRLNTSALEEEQRKHNISSDTELAARIGVSVTQIWRAKLSVEDPRHNSPGSVFIAGVIGAFGGPFEKYFFLEKVVRERNNNEQTSTA